jgi:Flp pilus assembly protein TadG
MGGRRRRERGNIGIWAALACTTVAGFMALSIHAGRSFSNRVELQNGADAAALAAAAQLDGTQAGVDAAAQAAATFGARHSTENESISIAPSDVTFGTWDRAAATFTPITGRTATDLQNIIAVRVGDARRDLPVALGPAFLGAPSTTSVGASAVAVGGGPCEDKCAFPGAFADCMMVNDDGSLKCDDRFYVLNNNWQDNFALSSLDPTKAASVPNIKDALPPKCVPTFADEQIPVTNGNPVQPVSAAMPGYPWEVIAPVVHIDRCEAAHYCPASVPTCKNAKFVGDLPIVGYVSIVLCYITGSTVKTWPPPDWGTSTTSAQAALWEECGPPPGPADFPGVPATQWPDPFLKQTIFIKHRCHWVDPGTTSRKAGCQSFGMWTTRSRLVQ